MSNHLLQANLWFRVYHIQPLICFNQLAFGRKKLIDGRGSTVLPAWLIKRVLRAFSTQPFYQVTPQRTNKASVDWTAPMIVAQKTKPWFILAAHRSNLSWNVRFWVSEKLGLALSGGDGILMLVMMMGQGEGQISQLSQWSDTYWRRGRCSWPHGEREASSTIRPCPHSWPRPILIAAGPTWISGTRSKFPPAPLPSSVDTHTINTLFCPKVQRSPSSGICSLMQLLNVTQETGSRSIFQRPA